MKAYVTLDDAEPVYPVFNLTDNKTAGVEIQATNAQYKRWKAAAKAYVKAQAEIHSLVDLYQPAALKAPRKKK